MSDCDCDAKLASLTSAVERMTDKLAETIFALNTLGEQSQAHTNDLRSIVQQVSEFGSSLGRMGPAGLIKMMTGRGNGNG